MLKRGLHWVLAQFAAGQGWGELYRAAGLHPGGRGLGSLLGHGHGKPAPDGAEPGVP